MTHLLQIADSSTGTAGTQAKSILEFGYGYHFAKCLNVPDTLAYKSSKINSRITTAEMSDFVITVEPNPATDWTVFHYKLPDDLTEVVINITDVYGKQVATLNISEKQGQKLWDTRSLKAGAYFYNSSFRGNTRSGKIIVNK